MALTLKSGSSGTITIDASDTSSNFTLNLPASGGVLITSGSGNTGGMILPSGNTAQRPTSPSDGKIRYNTTLGYTEFSSNGFWFNITDTGKVNLSYVIIAGGAGGGTGYGAGGGAGGYLNGTSYPTKGTTYTITVGAGGAVGTKGTNSSFTLVSTIAIGGGAGNTGATGGSGGGAGTSAAGAGTAGQGFAGGTSASGGSGQIYGGGGGGAGGVGGNAIYDTRGGDGGIGIRIPSGFNTLTGTYVAGGGTGYRQGYGGTGGAIALGSTSYGGGGDSYNPSAGNAGIVILSIPSIYYSGTYTGTPTVVSNNSFTIMTFTSSGSYTA